MKFNQTNTVKTENADGYAAYKMSDKERLVCACLTSMFGEPKFYGNTDGDIAYFAINLCRNGEGKFVSNLARYARNEGNMRSVSHVLTAIIAREAPEYIRQTVDGIIVRPDDITETMSVYKTLYGKFPNGLKRAIADAMHKFNEYQFAKYNGQKKSLKFRDVLRICHPKPENDEQSALYAKILTDSLDTPYTWETELSEKGGTKEVWDALIASGKLGYMAELRNLRNMQNAGADMTKVISDLRDPRKVATNRQFPYRYYSAYHALKNAHANNDELFGALHDAMNLSIENVPKIEGRTLIAVDVSGSMDCAISRHSDVSCADIARLFGAMSARICEDATVVYFSDGWYSYSYLWRTSNEMKGYRAEKYGKYDDVLAIAERRISVGTGGTDMHLPFKYALEDDTNSTPFDRIIVFSDNVCNSDWAGLYKTCQSDADKYRREKNPNLWVHGIDLQGYGTQQFHGDKFNVIAGWSDSVWSFINMAEQGFGSLVKTIENY